MSDINVQSFFGSFTLDHYFDKVFYINLKKDVGRNDAMLGQFEKFKITNFERVEGIRIDVIPGIEKYRNFNRNHEKYILGQLSCRASHLHIMKMAKERNYAKVLILEDDAIFLEDPNWLLAQNHYVLNQWDMLYFGGDIEPHFRNQIVRTHAYAVKNTLFDNIINMAEASGMEIDNFYAKILQQMSYNHNRSGKYDIRVITPFNHIVQNPVFISNIH